MANLPSLTQRSDFANAAIISSVPIGVGIYLLLNPNDGLQLLDVASCRTTDPEARQRVEACDAPRLAEALDMV